MYIEIRKYEGKASLADKLIPPVRDELVPMLMRSAGFELYLGFASLEGAVVSATIFEDYKSAMQARDKTREWIGSRMKGLLPSEIFAGEVLFNNLNITKESEWDNKCIIVHVYKNLGPKESAALLIRDHIAAALGEQGCCACCTFLDEQSDGCGISLSIYENIEEATTADEKFLKKLREKRVTPDPPSIDLGKVAISPSKSQDQVGQSEARTIGDYNNEAEQVLQMAIDIYWEIKRGVRQVNDEAESELGRWVNILSYVVDNSIDGLLLPLRAKDLIKRAELAIDIILIKPQGSLNLVREMRHEIIMDIYRAEDKFSRRLLEFTNGSPSFTVVLGVAAASVFFILLLTLFHLVPELNLFHRMDSYFKPALLIGSIEAAAIAAFAGGVVSVLTRLEQFEARRGIDPKLLFLNAAARPYIGAVMAMFVVAVQGFGLVSVAEAKPEGNNFAFFLIVIGFLSGFSERFAADFIGSVEGGLGRSSSRNTTNT